MNTTSLLNAHDVAQILKISKPLAYRLIAEGQLPAVKFRRTVRVRQDDLDEFIKKNLSSKDNPFTTYFPSNKEAVQ
jgi:excisionase family DNA binding protein